METKKRTNIEDVTQFSLADNENIRRRGKYPCTRITRNITVRKRKDRKGNRRQVIWRQRLVRIKKSMLFGPRIDRPFFKFS